MDRSQGSAWSLRTHRRAPDLDSYGPIGSGVSEQRLLAETPTDRASLCRCGHRQRDHAGARHLGWCAVGGWVRDYRMRGAMALADCHCRAYDPELPGELAEEYGR